MSRVSIPWEEVREKMMSQPGFKEALEAVDREERLRDMLAQWRKHAGLTRAQVAKRMGVSAPTVSRMEANVTRASLDTLTRYALACGVESPTIQLY